MKTLVLLALGAAATFAQPATFDIDGSHSSVGFSVRHMMVNNVKGQFSTVKGSAAYDAKNPAASKVEATIDVASVNTGEPKRDAHLRTPDFFDSAKFPTMTFTSKAFTKAGKGWKIKGDLTLHGVTKEVVLDAEPPTPEIKDPYGNQRIGLTATGLINRKDFGLTWSKTMDGGGLVVGDEVKITLEMEFVKRKS